MTNPLDDPALNEGQPPDPTDAELGSVANLARRQKQLEAEVIEATAVLRTKIAAYWEVAMHDLPRAMKTAGTESFSVSGGDKVELRTVFSGTKLSSKEGLAYVEENGGGALINTAILLEMDRGDLEAAREIIAELRASRHANKFKTLALTEYIYPGTVAKFAKDLILQRKDPDLQLLGVSRLSYAVVGDRPKPVALNGFEKKK